MTQWFNCLEVDVSSILTFFRGFRSSRGSDSVESLLRPRDTNGIRALCSAADEGLLAMWPVCCQDTPGTDREIGYSLVNPAI